MSKDECSCSECVELQEQEEAFERFDPEPRCKCGTLLEGQYNNGEEHNECAPCREGRLCDEAYEWERDYELSEEAYHDD